MKFRFLLITAILPVLFLACDLAEGGLFYSLEKESAIVNGLLADNITIGAFEKSNGYYFMGAGRFMYREAVDGSWPDDDTSQNPEGYDSYLCNKFTIVGNDLYAVFYNIAGSDFTVFKGNTSAPADGLGWTELTFSGIDSTEKIIDLMYLQDKFFVYTMTSVYKYNLYMTDSATLASGSGFTAVKSDMYVGGELSADYDGSLYWIAVGNSVLTIDGADTVADLTSAVVSASSGYLQGNGFGGILCADTDGDLTDEVYVTSEEGVMMLYNSGTWSKIECQYDTDDGLFSPLKGLSHIEISSEGINIIVAGSDSGYYEMPIDTDIFVMPSKVDTTLSTKTQFESIALDDNIVNDLFYDSDNGNIFALCSSGGLWINTIKSGERFWDLE